MDYGIFAMDSGVNLSEQWGIRPLYFLIGSIICTVSILGILLPYFRFMDDSSINNDITS
ncbi:hypothetical protein MHH81_10380 [Psychrobacillus sp. FSL H8-0484]|uniref:hypothetical protein n=1 Tax=Psychrobacillus sp. FSL H8-0484 TaxID=2921390 RepID=UPI0030F89697